MSKIQEFWHKRKKVLSVSFAALVIAGGSGYYYFNYHNKPVAKTSSAQNHIMAMGDVVTLDAKARALAGVQTAKATVRPLTRVVRAAGVVVPNEGARTYLTSRIEGRIDELYVAAPGEYIAPNEVIAAVYSPTYLSAQTEYVLTLENEEKLQQASPDVIALNRNIREAAAQKLRLLQVPEEEIANLAATREIKQTMLLRSQFGGTVLEKNIAPGSFIMPGDKLFGLTDLSSVWVNADLYAKDLAVASTGLTAEITGAGLGNEKVSGIVSFVSPLLDETTRTAKLRINVDNSGGFLKPNMPVNVALQIPLAEGIVIPISAVIDTGERKIVFTTKEEGTYIRREIVTGNSNNGLVQVLSGLQAGEEIVTQATFLLDSQTQLGTYGSHAGHDMSSMSETSAGNSAPTSNNATQAGSEHSGHGN